MSSNWAYADADDEPQRRTTRPALDVLDRDQDRLLYDGDPRRDPPIEALGRGFSSYWMVLSWYQAAGIRTLGHVERVLMPVDIMPEAGVMDHLLLANESPESPYVRRRLVERMDDACDMAYRQFRERANERVGTDESARTYEQVDPEKEKNPLMRPAFRRLDQEQAGALCQLWGGFENREAVGRWVRSLATVSNGEKPPGLVDEIVESEPLLTAFLSTGPAAKLTRYRFAVDEVLPLFLTGARTLNGGEHTDAARTSHGAYTT